MLSAESLALFQCPACAAPLSARGEALACAGCGGEFAAEAGPGILHLVRDDKSALIEEINRNWTNHWQKSSAGFHVVTAFIRRHLTAPLVRGALAESVSGGAKVFLEAGSGTSETSVLVEFNGHVSISLDISDAVLRRNVNGQIKLQGDLFNIPMRAESVDVIFNVGVHEHYSDEQNLEILAGFRRILRPGGRVVLMWPWYWAPLMILGRTINVVMSVLKGRKYELYPNQYWELRCWKQADSLLTRAGLRRVRHYLSLVDLCSMMVLVYERPG